jgi:hypothetical protein
MADVTRTVKWSAIGVGAWVAGGVAFAAWEANALRKKDSLPTFTNVVKTYVPRWLLAMLLGWLSFHFLQGPADRR